jgi:tripeptide aminopeptidase
MNNLVNKNRLIKTFFDMVQIDSESGSEAEFANYMISLGREFSEKVKKDKHNNVYITIKGTGKPLMLNTHMDTVSPGTGIKPRVTDGYVESSENTILGADSKAGIAAMIEVVRILKENNIENRPFLVTLTCNEESGIPTAEFIKSEIKECIVPDRGTPLGEIITKAPYAQVFEVIVKGKSVYATTDFNKGRHAILAASEMINKLPIGNFDNESTSNIGIISGGTVTSIVPDLCKFKGNCYSFDKKSLKIFFDKLEKVVKLVDKKYKTESGIIMHEYFEGFEIPKSDPLVQKAINAISLAGIKPKFKTYKAVSNANILNSIGIKSVLISTGVENQHTVKERISVDDLVKLTEIIFNLAKN